MNEIKVTVTYDKPTTSKFDALMAEYEAAKQFADETVSYYKPLADAAEEAKFDAIMEQLETIKEYAMKISKIKNNNDVKIIAYIPSHICHSIGSDGQEFCVVYHPQRPIANQWEIRSKHGQFTRGSISYHSKKSENFIGNWDEWNVYKELEKSAIRQLNELIDAQKRRAEAEINRLNNITKRGN